MTEVLKVLMRVVEHCLLIDRDVLGTYLLGGRRRESKEPGA